MSTIYVEYPQGGGGGVTGSVTGIPYVVGPIDGAPPNDFGGYIGSFTFYQQTATALYPGLVSSANQTFSGVKTFLSPSAFPSLAMGPVRIDGGNALSIGSTNLTNEVVGILPSGNGGSGTSTSWIQGSVIFAGGSSSFTQDNSNLFYNSAAIRLGIGTNAPTSDLGFGGDVTRAIGLNRNSTTAGAVLSISAGAALLGGTDLSGGTLQLRSGVSTGIGLSAITFTTSTPNTVSSTGDNAGSVKMALTGTGFLGIGTAVPAATLDITAIRLGTPSAGGSQVEIRGIAFTDINTAANGTNATFVGSRFNLPTLTSSNTNVTTTNASTITISGGVNAGNNTTLTNSSALRLTGGAVTGTVTNYYQLFISGVGAGGVNNYAASIAGLVGMGGAVDPMANLEIATSSKTVSSSEQLCLRSQRNAIVSGDLIGGISYRSNDTNLTAPGIVVALTDAVAEATHTTSVLDTGLAFYTTKTLFTSESMRISGAGFVGIGKTVPTVSLDIRGQMNINGSTSGFFGLKAADAAGSVVYTWPTTAGTAGQFMQSNGVGSLTFATVTAGSLVGSVSLVNQVVGNLPLTQTSGSISLTNQVSGILPIVNGGTGTSSFTNGSIPYMSSTGTLAQANPGLIWDQTNGVLITNKHFVPSIAIGSTTVTSSTGGQAYTLALPGTLGSSSQVMVNDGAGHLSWRNFSFIPTITTLTTGSGTYTTPANVRYLRVRMAGPGGGGASGQGSAGINNGTSGSVPTTFGILIGSTSVLQCTAGQGGTYSGAVGGSATVSSTAIQIVAVSGGTGTGASFTGLVGATPGTKVSGGCGGSNAFGGAGGGGSANDAGSPTGFAAAVNTGAGGGGGGTGANSSSYGGGGGGAGGYIEAIFPLPAATYAWTVGSSGAGGAATTGCGAGGNGANGIIIVEEYY